MIPRPLTTGVPSFPTGRTNLQVGGIAGCPDAIQFLQTIKPRGDSRSGNGDSGGGSGGGGGGGVMMMPLRGSGAMWPGAAPGGVQHTQTSHPHLAAPRGVTQFGNVSAAGAPKTGYSDYSYTGKRAEAETAVEALLGVVKTKRPPPPSPFKPPPWVPNDDNEQPPGQQPRSGSAAAATAATAAIVAPGSRAGRPRPPTGPSGYVAPHSAAASRGGTGYGSGSSRGRPSTGMVGGINLSDDTTEALLDELTKRGLMPTRPDTASMEMALKSLTSSWDEVRGGGADAGGSWRRLATSHSRRIGGSRGGLASSRGIASRGPL